MFFILISFSSFFPSAMDSLINVVPTPHQFVALKRKYRFHPENGVAFPGENSSFINPPEGKLVFRRGWVIWMCWLRNELEVFGIVRWILWISSCRLSPSVIKLLLLMLLPFKMLSDAEPLRNLRGQPQSIMLVWMVEVIDIYDDVNIEKGYVPDSNVYMDDVGINHTITPEVSKLIDVIVGGTGSVCGAQFFGFGHGGSVVVGEGEEQGSNSVGFFPYWSLMDNSLLSVFDVAIDFTKNVLPYGIAVEMASYSLFDFVRSLRFAAAQSPCRLRRVLIVWSSFLKVMKSTTICKRRCIPYV
ncbi:unnamed protein product [Lactuca virosa]|uniref:Uncharacterized protein n=1 Tax=Lactuca virosa TaxID=75947 RepID=A0AAU9PL32_9ASTR|nr:unnamed protein product [Lactuca virosa]